MPFAFRVSKIAATTSARERHLREGHRTGRVEEAVEVGVELEDPAVVDPEALPYGVAALDRAVEDRDLGLARGRRRPPTQTWIPAFRGSGSSGERVVIASSKSLSHGPV
jgi:hypothetical protein